MFAMKALTTPYIVYRMLILSVFWNTIIFIIEVLYLSLKKLTRWTGKPFAVMPIGLAMNVWKEDLWNVLKVCFLGYEFENWKGFFSNNTSNLCNWHLFNCYWKAKSTMHVSCVCEWYVFQNHSNRGSPSTY